MQNLKALIEKYSKPGPRYTSYPTAPQWSESLGKNEYARELEQSDPKKPLALYVHIPFCESLCYYCGCNIKISSDPSVGAPYVDLLLKEIKAVSGYLGSKRTLSQISWGGGTPTYLDVTQISRLQNGIKEHFDIEQSAEVSIEIDPRVTTSAQLKVLRELGFNRVSLGVQDFNLGVQKAVNRVQSEALTVGMLSECRELGYSGINFDLIYGLPLQTLASFQETISQVVRARPDRIALYNYAHLPSLRPHQKILEKQAMPSAGERIAIFEFAYQALTDNGYLPIGMDHFAVKEDELSKSLEKGTLYRNFMGYTVKRGTNLIGLGASAIGELENGFFQNVREVHQYKEKIEAEGLASFRGCLYSAEDRRRKWIIQKMMCEFWISYGEYEQTFHGSFEKDFSKQLSALAPLQEDGILELENEGVRITSLGRLFVRNAAMEFDEYLGRPQKATYSKTV